EMCAAILAFHPAVAVASRGEGEGLGLAELDPAPTLDLGAEGIEPAVLDRVFEPCVLALRAVAPVALHGDNRLGHRNRVLRPAEADNIGGARIGLGLAMGHAHAATGR